MGNFQHKKFILSSTGTALLVVDYIMSSFIMGKFSRTYNWEMLINIDTLKKKTIYSSLKYDLYIHFSQSIT